MARSSPSTRARLRAAQSETEAAEARLLRDTSELQAWYQRHRTALIVAGGFTAGFTLSSLPPKVWSAIGAATAAGAAALARSLLTPMLAGAIIARKQGAAAATGRPDGAEAP